MGSFVSSGSYTGSVCTYNAQNIGMSANYLSVINTANNNCLTCSYLKDVSYFGSPIVDSFFTTMSSTVPTTINQTSLSANSWYYIYVTCPTPSLSLTNMSVSVTKANSIFNATQTIGSSINLATPSTVSLTAPISGLSFIVGVFKGSCFMFTGSIVTVTGSITIDGYVSPGPTKYYITYVQATDNNSYPSFKLSTSIQNLQSNTYVSVDFGNTANGSSFIFNTPLIYNTFTTLPYSNSNIVLFKYFIADSIFPDGTCITYTDKSAFSFFKNNSGIFYVLNTSSPLFSALSILTGQQITAFGKGFVLVTINPLLYLNNVSAFANSTKTANTFLSYGVAYNPFDLSYDPYLTGLASILINSSVQFNIGTSVVISKNSTRPFANTLGFSLTPGTISTGLSNTYYIRIGAVKTDFFGNFLRIVQKDNKVRYSPNALITSTSAPAFNVTDTVLGGAQTSYSNTFYPVIFDTISTGISLSGFIGINDNAVSALNTISPSRYTNRCSCVPITAISIFVSTTSFGANLNFVSVSSFKSPYTYDTSTGAIMTSAPMIANACVAATSIQNQSGELYLESDYIYCNISASGGIYCIGWTDSL